MQKTNKILVVLLVVTLLSFGSRVEALAKDKHIKPSKAK